MAEAVVMAQTPMLQVEAEAAEVALVPLEVVHQAPQAQMVATQLSKVQHRGTPLVVVAGKVQM